MAKRKGRRARRAPLPALRPLARFVRRSLLVSAGVAAAQPAYLPEALAGPKGESVVAGSGSVSRPDARTTVVHQQSHRVAIDWQSFDVSSQELVRFDQPSVSAAALNRILDQSPSRIFGTIRANGRIFLLNPRGVIFGVGSRVDVGSLFAGTLDITTDDFMSGNYRFSASPGEVPGRVVNRGLITAASGGSVSLVGGSVSNEGVILADFGHVSLAAGRKAYLDFDGDGLIRFEVDGELIENAEGVDAAVSNSGEIRADGGQILLQANVARDVFTHAVNNEGLLRAGKIDKSGGSVRLVGLGGSARNAGTIDVSASELGEDGGDVSVVGDDVAQLGTITADAATGDGGSVHLEATAEATGDAGGTTTLDDGSTTSARSLEGGRGGTVQALGERVGLFGDAAVDVSGDAGGGTALIGGDYQGANPAVRNAKRTYVGPDATIRADAGTEGDGGTVIVWADEVTRAFGKISARGGAEGGDGGLVETSGKQDLEVTRTPDVTAPAGDGGLWLVDPNDITIVAGAGNVNINDADPFVSSNDGATLGVDLIVNALTGGASVSVTTGTGGTDAEDGDILLDAPLDYDGTGNNSLSLIAHDDVFINNSISDSSGATADLLNITLQADSDDSGTGNLVFNAGGSVASGGGDITMIGADVDLAAGSVNAGAGSVAILPTDNRTVGVGAGAGDMTISDADLGAITTSGGLVIGNAATGDITVDGVTAANTAGITATTTITAGAANDDVIFSGADSEFTDALTVNANDRIDLGTNVTTGGGTMIFNDPVLLTASVTLVDSGATGVTFNDVVDSASGNNFDLTVNASGDTVFNGRVGGDQLGGASDNNGLGSVTTDAGGRTLINEREVITTGDQSYGDDLVLNRSGNQTLDAGGTLSTAGAVDKLGTGNLRLDGITVDLDGNVNVQANDLVFLGTNVSAAGDLLADRDIDLRGLALTLDGTDDQRIAAGRTLQADGLVRGAGSLTLGGATVIDLGGTVNVASGALVIEDDFTASGDLLASGSVSLDGAGTLDAAGAQRVNAASGTLTASGALSKPSGDLTLAAGSAIDVAATVNAGTGGLMLSGDYTAGGDLLAGGDLTAEGAGTLDGTAAQTVAASGTLTLNGALTKTAAGNLTLGGGNAIDLAGTVDAQSGALTVSDAFSAEADLLASAGVTLSGAGTLDGSAAQTVDSGTGTLLAGSLVKTGTGNLTLAGGAGLDLDGDVAVNASDLVVNGDFSANGDLTATTDIFLNGDGTLDGTVDQSIDAGQSLFANGSLTKTATGDLILNAGAGIDLGGDVNVAGGDLVIGQDSNVAADLVASGNVDLTSIGVTLDGTGDQRIAAGNNLLTNALEKSTASLTLGGAGNVALGGTVNVGSGDLLIEDDFTASGDVLANGNVRLDGAGTLDANGDQAIDAATGTLAANGSLTKGGTGDLTLSAGGTLDLDGTVDAGTGSLTLTGDYLAEGDLLAGTNISVQGAGTLDGTAAQTLNAAAGTLTVNGTLDKTATGDLVLNAGAGIDLDGDVNVAGGDLVLAQDPDVAANLVASGNIDLTGISAALDGTADQRIAAGNNLLTDALAKATASLTLGGAGNIDLGGTVNVGTGALVVEDDFTASGDLLAGAGMNLQGAGTLDGASAQTLDAGTGTLTAAANLQKTGTGDLTLSGASGVALGGDADVSASNLLITDDFTASGDLTATDDVILQGSGTLDGTAAQTIEATNGTLQAQGTLDKIATGDLTLTGGTAIELFDDVNVSTGDLVVSNDFTAAGNLTASADIDLTGLAASLNGAGAQTISAGATLLADGLTKATANLTLAGTQLIDIGGNVTVTDGAGADLVMSGNLALAGNLAATGNIDLTGLDATLDGGATDQTIDAGGTLSADDLTKGAANLTLIGGTLIDLDGDVDASTGDLVIQGDLRAAGNLTAGNNLDLSGLGLTLDGSVDQRLAAGANLSADALTKTGTGDLTLGGVTSIDLDGDVSVATGDLAFEDDFSAAGNLLAGGDIDLTAVSGTLDGTGDQTINVGGTLTADAITKGTSDLTLIGGTLLDLGGNVTVTDAGGANLVMQGSLALEGNLAATGNIDLTGLDATLDGTGDQTLDAGDTLSADDLTKSTADLTLIGTNLLDLDGNVAVTDAAGANLAMQGNLALGGNLSATGNIDLTGLNASLDGTDDQRIAAGVTLTADALTKSATGSLTLGGTTAVDLNGTVNVQSGSLVVEDDFTASGELLASAGMNLQGAGTLDGSAAQTLDAGTGTLAAAAGLRKIGTGNLTLTGAGVDVGGNVAVSASDLVIDGDYTAGGDLTATTDIRLNGNGVLDGTVDQTINAAQSLFANGSLTKSATGDLILNAGTGIALEGDVDVATGDLLIEQDASAAGDLVAGGNIDLTVVSVTLDGTGDQRIAAGDSLLTDAVDKATGSLTLGGAGSIDLGGTVNVQSGSLVIEDDFTTGSDLLASAGMNLQGAGTLDATVAQTVDAGTGTLATQSTLDKLNTGDLTLSGGAGLDLGGDVNVANDDLALTDDLSAAGNLTAGNNLDLSGLGLTLDGTVDQRLAAGANLSADALTKTGTGDLTLGGVTSIDLDGDVSVATGDLAFEDDFSAAGNLLAGGDIDLTAVSGTLDGTGDQTINVGGTLTADAITKGTSDLTLIGGTLLDLGGNVTVTDAGGANLVMQGSLALEGNLAATGNIDLTGLDATLDGTGDQTLDAGDTLSADDLTKSTADLTLIGTNLLDLDGNVAVTDAAGANLAMQGNLALGGNLSATGNIDLTGLNASLDGTDDQRIAAGVTLTADALTKSATGNLTLGGATAVDLNGTVNVQSGSLVVEDDFTASGELLASAGMNLQGAGTLDGSAAQTLDAGTGTLAAAAELRKIGTGNLTLAGGAGVSLGGTANVSASDLLIDDDFTASADLIASTNVTLQGAGTFDGTVDQTVEATAGTLRAQASLDKIATGDLTLTGGALIDLDGDVDVATDDLVISNGFRSAANLTAGGNIDLTGLAATLDGGGDQRIAAGNVLATDALNKGAAGLTLGGTGGITLGGTVDATTGSLTIEDDFTASGNLTAGTGVSLAGAGTLDATTAQTIDAAGGVLTADGDLSKTPAGDLTLSGTAGIDLGGNVTTANNLALSDDLLITDDFSAAGNLVAGDNLTLQGDGTLDGAGAQTVDAAGATGSLLVQGSLAKTTAGDLTLSGTVAVDLDGDVGVAVDDLIITDDFSAAGNLSAGGNLDLTAVNGTLDGTGAQTINVGGTLTAGDVTKSTANLTLIGGTLLDLGGNVTATDAGGADLVMQGSLALAGNLVATGNIDLTGLDATLDGTADQTLNAGDTLTVDDLVKNTEDLVLVGGTAVNLAGNIDVTNGNLDLSGLALQLTSVADQTLTAGNNLVSDGLTKSTASLTLGGAGNIDLSGNIAVSTGDLVFQNNFSVAGNLTAGGDIDISVVSGTLDGTTDQTINVGGTLTADDVTKGTANLTLLGTLLDLDGNVSVTDGAGADLVMQGGLELAGNLLATGDIDLTGLDATLDGAGDQTINAGGALTSDDLFKQFSDLTLTGAGAIDLNGDVEAFFNNLVITNAFTAAGNLIAGDVLDLTGLASTLDGAVDQRLAGATLLTDALAKTGNGNLTLAGTTVLDVNGTVNVQNGGLVVEDDFTAAGDLLASAGVNLQGAGTLDGTAAQTLDAGAGTLAAAANLQKTGTGNLTLSGQAGVSLGGTANVNASDLLITDDFTASADLIASTNVTLQGDGVLNGAVDQTIEASAGSLLAQGTLDKVATGDLTLTGGSAIDLDGDVNVATGDLVISNGFSAAGNLTASGDIDLTGLASSLDGTGDQRIAAGNNLLTDALTKPTASLTLGGAGNVDLGGTVNVQSGSLVVEDDFTAAGDLLGSTGVNLAGAGTLDVTVTQTVDAGTGTLTAQSTLDKINTGDLTLAGDGGVDLDGDVNVAADDLVIGNDFTAAGNLTAGTNLDLSGLAGTLDGTGDQTINVGDTLTAADVSKTTANLTLIGGTLIDLDGNVAVTDPAEGSLAMQGNLALAGNLSATGNIDLTGLAATLDGTTDQTISAGNALTSDAVTKATANLTLIGTQLIDLDGDVTVTDAGGADLVMQGNLAAAGNLAATGNIDLTGLNATLDGTGDQTINAGDTLTADDLTKNSADLTLIGTTLLDLNGNVAVADGAGADLVMQGNLALAGNLAATGNIDLTGLNATLDGATDQTIDAGDALTADGFAKAATGNLTLAGTNAIDLDGTVNVQSGGLLVADDFSAAGDLLGSAGVDLAGAGTLDGTVDQTVDAGAGTLTAQATLDKPGTGDLTLSGAGAVDLDGDVNVATGDLAVSDDFAAAGNLTAGGNIDLTGLAATLDGAGDQTVSAGVTLRADGLAKGTGNLTLGGPTLIDLDGDVDVTTGDLVINDAFSAAGNLTAGGNIDVTGLLSTLDGTADQRIAAGGTLAADALTKATASLTLGGTNQIDLNGSVNVQSGSLIVENDFTAAGDLLGSTGVSLAGAGTLDGTTGQTIDASTGSLTAQTSLDKTAPGDLTLDGDGGIDLDGDVNVATADLVIGNDFMAAGNLSAGGNLDLSGLAATLDGTGDQTINVGVNLTANDVTKATANLTLIGGTLLDIDGNVTVTDGAGANLAMQGNLALAGNLAATGNIDLTGLNATLDGAADQTLNAGDTLTVDDLTKGTADLTLIGASLIDLNGNVAVTDVAGADLVMTGNLELAGNLAATGNIDLTGIPTTLDGANDQTIDAGNSLATVDLTKTAAGDLTLGGANALDLDGTVDVQTGALRVQDDFTASGDLLASTGINLAGAGTLDATVAQVVNAGAGTLVAQSTLDKVGTGNLTLSGQAGVSLGGTANVNASDLLITDDFTASADLIASTNVTLQGDGVLNGAVDQTIEASAGSLLAQGTLDKVATGDLTLTGGSAIDLDGDVNVATGDLVISNGFSAAGNLTASGDIDLTGLASSLDGTGDQRIAAGNNLLTDALTKPTASLTLGGAGNVDLGGTVNVQSGSLVVEDDFTAAGDLLGSTGVNLAGAGTLDVTVTQTVDAGTGTLTAQSTLDKINTGDLTLAGDGGVDLDGDVNVAADDLVIGNDFTAAGNLTAGADLDLAGVDGTLDGAGDQTLSAGSTLSANALSKATASLTLSGTSAIDLGGDVDATTGSLVVTDDFTTAGNLTAGTDVSLAGAGTLDGTADQTVDAVNGTLTADAALTKTGTGDLTLGGDAGIGLGATVDAQSGNLVVEDDFTAAGDLLASTDVTLQGNGVLNGAVDQTVEATAGTLQAQGTLDKTATGDLTLTGGALIDLDGDVDVATDDLVISDDFAAAGNLTAGGDIDLTGLASTLDGTADQRIAAGATLRADALAKGTANLTLGGISRIDLDGTADVQSGSLRVEDDFTASGDLLASAGINLAGAGTLDGTAAQTINAGAGTLVAQSSLDKIGTGNLTLTGAAGVSLGGDASVNASDLLITDDFTASGNLLASTNVTLLGSGTFDATVDQFVNASTGNLLASGTLDKVATGDLTLAAGVGIDVDGDVNVAIGDLVLLQDFSAAGNLTAGGDLDLTGVDGTLDGTGDQTLSAGATLSANALSKATANLTLSGTAAIDVDGDVDVTTGDLVFSDDFSAAGNLTAGGDLDLTGVDGTLDGGADQTLSAGATLSANALSKATANLTLSGTNAIDVGGDVDVTNGDLVLSDDFSAAGNLTAGGDLDLTGVDGTLDGTADQTLSAGDTLSTNALDKATASLTLSGTNAIDVGGDVGVATGDLVVTDDFTAAGNLVAGGSVSLAGAGTFDGAGDQTVEGTAGTLTADASLDKSTTGNLTLTGGTGVDLDADVTVATDALFVNGDFTAAGDLSAGNGMSFADAGTFDGVGDQTANAGTGTLAAGSTLDKSTAGDLILNGSLVDMDDDVNVSGGNLNIAFGSNFQAAGNLTASGELDIQFLSGTLDGTTDQTLAADSDNDDLGGLTASTDIVKTTTGDLTLSGATVDIPGNVGVTSAGADLVIGKNDGSSLSIDINGSISADGDITLRGSGMDVAGEVNAANGDIVMDGDLALAGNLSAGGNIDLTPGGGLLGLDLTLDGTGDQTINAGGTLTILDLTKANGDLFLGNNNVIISGNIDVTGGSLDLSGLGLTLDGTTDQTIQANDTLTSDGLLKSTANLTLGGGNSIDLSGNIVVSAGDLVFLNNFSVAGNLVTGGNIDLTLVPGVFGTLDGTGDQTINVGGTLTTSDVTKNPGNLTLQGGTLDLDGNVSVTAGDLVMQGNLQLGGNLSAGNNIDLTGLSGNLGGGSDQTLNAGNTLTVEDLQKGAANLTLAGGTIDINGDVNVSAGDLVIENDFSATGSLLAGGDIDLSAITPTLDGTTDQRIAAGGDLDLANVSKTLGGNLSIGGTGNSINLSGALNAGTGDLIFEPGYRVVGDLNSTGAGDVRMQGPGTFAGGVNVTSGGLIDLSGTTNATGGDLTFVTPVRVVGNVAASANLTFQATATVTSGVPVVIASNGAGSSLVFAGTLSAGGGPVTLQAEEIELPATVNGGGETLTIQQANNVSLGVGTAPTANQLDIEPGELGAINGFSEIVLGTNGTVGGVLAGTSNVRDPLRIRGGTFDLAGNTVLDASGAAGGGVVTLQIDVVSTDLDTFEIRGTTRFQDESPISPDPAVMLDADTTVVASTLTLDDIDVQTAALLIADSITIDGDATGIDGIVLAPRELLSPIVLEDTDAGSWLVATGDTFEGFTPRVSIGGTAPPDTAAVQAGSITFNSSYEFGGPLTIVSAGDIFVDQSQGGRVESDGFLSVVALGLAEDTDGNVLDNNTASNDFAFIAPGAAFLAAGQIGNSPLTVDIRALQAGARVEATFDGNATAAGATAELAALERAFFQADELLVLFDAGLLDRLLAVNLRGTVLQGPTIITGQATEGQEQEGLTELGFIDESVFREFTLYAIEQGIKLPWDLREELSFPSFNAPVREPDESEEEYAERFEEWLAGVISEIESLLAERGESPEEIERIAWEVEFYLRSRNQGWTAEYRLQKRAELLAAEVPRAQLRERMFDEVAWVAPPAPALPELPVLPELPELPDVPPAGAEPLPDLPPAGADEGLPEGPSLPEPGDAGAAAPAPESLPPVPEQPAAPELPAAPEPDDAELPPLPDEGDLPPLPDEGDLPPLPDEGDLPPLPEESRAPGAVELLEGQARLGAPSHRGRPGGHAGQAWREGGIGVERGEWTRSRAPWPVSWPVV